MGLAGVKNFDYAKCIELLHKRQPQSMEMMYEQFSPVLFGVAMKIVKDEKTAGEILEKTFLHVWKNHSSFDESKQGLCMWMLGVLRKIAQEKVPFEAFIQNHHHLIYVDKIDDVGSTKKINTKSVNKAEVSLMTKEQNKVLDLIFHGGGKINEVANHLAMDEDKVKQLLHEAVNQFRKTSQLV